MTMLFKFLSSACLLACCLGGCTDSTLTAKDIKGTWILTEESRKHLPAPIRNATGKLVIDDKGNFDAVQLPGDLLWLSSAGDVKLITGTGVWTIDSVSGTQQLKLGFRKIEGKSGDSSLSGPQLLFSEDRPLSVIFYFRGDPDEGLRIEFKKVN